MQSEFRGTERFRLVRVLGAGGMGTVYEAEDRTRQIPVALKLLSHFGPRQLFQFKQEFRSLADAVHPNLVGLHELHSHGEHWFFTMDLVDGTDFSSYVRGPCRTPAPSTLTDETLPASSASELLDPHMLPAGGMDGGRSAPPGGAGEGGNPITGSGQTLVAPEQCAPPFWELDVEAESRLRRALAGLASGVTALHGTGIMHRDLKPSNVLVDSRGRAVILDFGLVSPAGGDPRVFRNIVSGTIPYMSPEQAEGGLVGPASDWYSVGVMLYEALAGRLPFGGTYSQMLAAKRSAGRTWKPGFLGPVPADLSALCIRLLSGRPEDRPSDREVLALLGSGTGATAQTTLVDGEHAIPLLGRERQLAELGVALDKARTGRCVVAWVHGRSGMGKTALLRAFLERTVKRGALVLSGRCYVGESVPYKGIDAVIDQLASFLEALPSGDVMSLMPRYLAALEHLFPVLAMRETTGDAAGRGGIVTDPQDTLRRAFCALRELLCRLGDREELVLAVDDLQWGDLDGARLLAELIRPPDAPAMLLVLSHRSEETAGGEALAAFRDAVGQHVPDEVTVEVEVGPLAAGEAEKMARLCCRAQKGDLAERARFVASESGGIPFFIEELARAFEWRGEHDAAGVSLDEYIRERVKGLPSFSRQFLDVLAVAARPLPQSLAWRAVGSPSIHMGSLKLLQGLHLVRTQGMGEHDPVECYHDRIREALSAGLSEGESRACHLALAVCWEGWTSRDNEAVAHHYLHAGHSERAAQFARLAAGEAAVALAFGKAATLYRMSLEHGDWGQEDVQALLAALGDVLAAAGRGKEAADAYLDAAGRASGDGQWRFLEKAAGQLLAAGHVEQGKEVLDQVLSRFGLSIPVSRVATLWSLAWLGFRKGMLSRRFVPRPASQIAQEILDRIDVCRASAVNMGMADPMRSAVFQQRAFILATGAGEPGRFARALAAEGGYAAAFGGKGYARSLELIGEAMRLAVEHSDPLALATSHACLAIALFQQGRWADAARQAVEGERICVENRLQARWEMHTCRLFQIGPLGWMGRYREFRARANELVADADSRHDLYEASHVRLGSPVPFGLLEDSPQRCADSLDAGSAVLAADEFSLYHVYWFRARCQLALYLGDVKTALELASQLHRRLHRSLLSRVAIARSFAQEALGNAVLASAGNGLERKAALSRLGRCIRDARRVGISWMDAVSDFWEAGACVLANDRASAMDLLQAAAGRFEAADMLGHAAACRYRKGNIEGGQAGRELRTAAIQALDKEQVVNPERLMDVIAPMPS